LETNSSLTSARANVTSALLESLYVRWVGVCLQWQAYRSCGEAKGVFSNLS